MKQGEKTREMVLTALLIALGIIIPIYFGFLRVVLPPAFTATLMAHVPIFIAMFISPWSAVFTAIGTTAGFAFAGLSPVVTARAASHIVFAVVIRRRWNLVAVGVVTALLHALFEGLTVYVFLKFGLMAATESSFVSAAFYVTGVGTLIHDTIDYIIACLIGLALAKAHIIAALPPVLKKKA